MLHLEDVFLVVVVDGQPRRLGRHLGLGRLLLGHERRTRRRLRDLDARQSCFLQEYRRRWVSLFIGGEKLPA